MKEYKISKGWAIFFYVAAPLMCVLFSYLLIAPWIPGTKENISSGAYPFIAPVSIAMIALMITGIADVVKSKFIIGTDSVTAINVFSTRQLLFDEIKGYRLADNYIFIEPAVENTKAIKLSKYFGNTNEIICWLADNYPDLDAVNANLERQDILSNETFGLSDEQRVEKLNKAQQVAKVLNIIGTVVSIWTFIFPRPYEYAIIISILFPVVCIISLQYFRGLIRIDDKKGSSYPSIATAVLLAPLGLCLRGLLDYNIFDYTNIWMPAILMTVFYLYFFITASKEFTFKNAKDYFTIAVLALCIFGYAYGAVVTLNCMYDKSDAIVYNATILNKRVSSGKSTTYYLELTPWGKQQHSDEVSVSKHLYNSANKGDSVQVHFKKGRFEIPWFEITK